MNYYTLSSKAKNITYVLMGIGVLALDIWLLCNQIFQATRFWANIFRRFYTLLSLHWAPYFLCRLQYVAQAGWSAVVKRMYEAIGRFFRLDYYYFPCYCCQCN